MVLYIFFTCQIAELKEEDMPMVVKEGAAQGSPLKSQESRFLIPNKTHRKAVLLAGVAPA